LIFEVCSSRVADEENQTRAHSNSKFYSGFPQTKGNPATRGKKKCTIGKYSRVVDDFVGHSQKDRWMV
jgi:hypothetical protein